VAQGPQKADHGGNFFMTPRRVLNSVAWRYLSLRARAVLQIFQDAHDGFNNGNIALSIHEISKRMGNQNHGANGRAVAELIEKGFLECTSDADRHQAKTREYRLTFVASGSKGKGRELANATHEYHDWRPEAGSRRKFGGAITAPQNSLTGAETAPMLKVTAAETAPTATVSRGFDATCRGAETALLIDNQSVGCPVAPESHPLNLVKSRGADLRLDLDVLRDWTCDVVAHRGYGGQRWLALHADVPEPILSRFRKGSTLPDRYRTALQMACGRVLPFSEWKVAAA
jgi:hypothetical protein